MEFSISIFKDAAEAFDKLIDSLSKLGTMLKSAANSGLDILDWKNARDAHEQLSRISISSAYLIQAQFSGFIPTLQQYADNPNIILWPSVQQKIVGTLIQVEDLGSEIKAGSPYIATQDFFEPLLGAVLQRQAALVRLSEIPAPTTEEEIDSLKVFLQKYLGLINELQEANGALRKYIDSLKVRGKWPSVGD